MEGQYQSELKHSLPPDVFADCGQATETGTEGHPLFPEQAKLSSRGYLSFSLCQHRFLQYNVLRLTEVVGPNDQNKIIKMASVISALKHPLIPLMLDIQNNSNSVSYYYQCPEVTFLSDSLLIQKLTLEEILHCVRDMISLLQLLNQNQMILTGFCKSNLFVDKSGRFLVLMLQSLYHGAEKATLPEMDYYIQREIQETGALLYELCTGKVPVLPCSLISQDRLGPALDKINFIIQKTTIQKNGRTLYSDLNEILEDLGQMRCHFREKHFLKQQKKKLEQRQRIMEMNQSVSALPESPSDMNGYGAPSGTVYEDMPTVYSFDDDPDSITENSNVQFTLQIVQTQQQYTFHKNSITIGRSPRADLLIDQIHVSRIHANLTALGKGKFELRELGTNHIIKVNGEQLIYTQTISEGDTFYIDNIAIRILP